MVVQTQKEAVDNAKRYTSCEQGMCLKYVRTWLEIGSRDASAKVAWENALGKHANDRTPPRAAPLFFKGGQYWHITLNFEDNASGAMRGTDMTSTGKVSTQAIAWVENHWGYPYVGWAEGINGVWIPYLKSGGGSGGGGGGGKDWRASGDVYVNKLKQGVKDSQSVSRLRFRLTNHNEMPDSRKCGYGDSAKDGANYTADVTDCAKYWMQQIWNGSHGTGENFTNDQANVLFGDNYNVIEE